MIRPETPWSALSPLYGEEFRRGRAYANWRPHGTKDWLLIYTAKGSGQIATPSASFETKPGDVILYGPGEYQDYGTSQKAGNWHLLWAHFLEKPSWQKWLRWGTHSTGVRKIHLEEGEARDQFVAAMHRMIHMARRSIPQSLDFAQNALEEALLWASVTTTKENWQGMDERVRRAIDYLAEHSTQPLQLKKLALRCGTSVPRLAVLFKRQTGGTPHQFLERQRMRAASQLLRVTSLNISEIAAQVGYENAFYFSNRFHRHFGKSPSLFRKAPSPLPKKTKSLKN